MPAICTYPAESMWAYMRWYCMDLFSLPMDDGGRYDTAHVTVNIVHFGENDSIAYLGLPAEVVQHIPIIPLKCDKFVE